MQPSNVRSATRACLAIAALLALAFGARPAQAQIGSDRYASIVVDAASGSILSAVNADELRYPASLTKMMTLYMLFEALRDRRVSLQQYVPVSLVAASMPPTKLGLVPGSLITVEQAVLGLVTKSANDAASALGEMMGGDEERFAQMMTVRARALGMTRTQFRNASGLPDWNQVTSARDMAILARHLIQDFPGFYHYFSTPSFVYSGRFVPNHQRLLQTYPGADGLKTGYTEASGYNVVTSAVHQDTRLIGVVLGASNGGERDLHMASLLDQGYERMGVAPVYMSRREQRVPSFISLAHAAPAPPPPPPATSNASFRSAPAARQSRAAAKALSGRAAAVRPAATRPSHGRAAPVRAAAQTSLRTAARLETPTSTVRIRPIGAKAPLRPAASSRVVEQAAGRRFPG